LGLASEGKLKAAQTRLANAEATAAEYAAAHPGEVKPNERYALGMTGLTEWMKANPKATPYQFQQAQRRFGMGENSAPTGPGGASEIPPDKFYGLKLDPQVQSDLESAIEEATAAGKPPEDAIMPIMRKYDLSGNEQNRIIRKVTGRLTGNYANTGGLMSQPYWMGASPLLWPILTYKTGKQAMALHPYAPWNQ
jgi:hypothetical protein